ncbi:YicC family protein [candidate division KSB1 bacterium]|nr:YicC family protein [candidate division KSB1 bacterium]
MVASMTGFGRAAIREGDTEVTVEIRSVNNRFLDVSLRVPRILANYEQKIKDLIGKALSRGRINISITIANGNTAISHLSLNRPLANAYVRLSRQMKKELGLKGKLRIDQLLLLPDILNADIPAEEDEKYWLLAERALTTALKELQNMRESEGRELQKDFKTRIRNLEKSIKKIETLSANRPQQELDKLRQRIKSIVNEENVDEGRMEMELSFLADRLDVTEECVRFHSHNKAFIQMLETESAPGRKLNFLLQEMNREANTIGNKASSAEISHLVVEIKDEVEKLREQIQNIE